GGPMRGTPAGLQWNSGSSCVPLRSRYWTRSQNSGLYIGTSGPMRCVTPESRSKLMPGAQLPASNCCVEQGRPRCRTVRLPFSSGLAAPPPPPPPHIPERSGCPSAVRGVGTAPAGFCAWRDTRLIAAATAAAMANRFSCVMGSEVVRVVRVFVIHRHGPPVGEREGDDAARVAAVAGGRIADLQRLADRENACHPVGPERLRTRARDLPLGDGAVRLLHVEEPADVRVDHRELGQGPGELATLRGVELRLQRMMRNGRLRRQAQSDNGQKTEYLFHDCTSP